MDEREWLTSKDPQAMLSFLLGTDCASERKVRLVAAACCRRLWPHVHRGVRRVVEVVERLADGEADRDELERAARAPEALPGWGGRLPLDVWVGLRRQLRASVPDPDLSQAVVLLAAEAGVWRKPQHGEQRTRGAGEDWGSWLPSLWRSVPWGRRGAERRSQCVLVRDIFGPLPFPDPPTVLPQVFRWNEGTVKRLAEQAYQERLLPSGHLDQQRLAVLADALEEAGGNPELLGHLRGPGPHVRGCYLLDLLTGRG